MLIQLLIFFVVLHWVRSLSSRSHQTSEQRHKKDNTQGKQEKNRQPGLKILKEQEIHVERKPFNPQDSQNS